LVSKSFYRTLLALAFSLSLFSIHAFAIPLIGVDLASFSILSGGYISYGAETSVNGSIGAISYITPGNLGPSSSLYLNTPSVTSGLAELLDAKSALNNMVAGALLSTTLSGNNTFTPGVYSASDLTTAAGSLLTLDGNGEVNPYWVFNIVTYLSLGEATQIHIINAGSNSGVFWNTGGYASLGANSSFLGTLLSSGYISEGAGASIPCGSAYSLSYVSVGAGATVGSGICESIGSWAGSITSLSGSLDIINGVAFSSIFSAVPEADTSAMLLMGVSFMGLIARRRKTLKLN